MTDQQRACPKIIFFDIDDTLYIKDEQRIPESVHGALMALKEQGIIIAIATGRSLGIIPQPIRELIEAVGIEYLLTMNGQHNQYQGKLLFHHPLTPEKILSIFNVFDGHQIATAYMTQSKVYYFNDSDHLQSALGSLNIHPILVDRHAADFLNEPIYQILAFYTEEEGLDLQLPDGIKTTRWHPSAVDVLDNRSSKARAITQLLTDLKIDVKDAAAFGDGLNDVEMFELVGTAIAMGNAHPQAKQAADITAPRHDQDGIAKILANLGWIT